MSQKCAITAFLSQKIMITRLSIAFEDLLGSSIASQVMTHCRTLLLYCFKSTSWLPSETDLSLFLLQDKPEAERRRRRKNEILILTLLQYLCQVAAQNTFVHTKSSYLLRKIFNNLLYFICFGVPFWNFFFVVNKRGLLRDMCDTKLVLRIGLKRNMQINVFRVNDNILGFCLLLQGCIDASQMQCNKVCNL